MDGVYLIGLICETYREHLTYCENKQCNSDNCVIGKTRRKLKINTFCGIIYPTFKFDCLERVLEIERAYEDYCRDKTCDTCPVKKLDKYINVSERPDCHEIFTILYINDGLELIRECD